MNQSYIKRIVCIVIALLLFAMAILPIIVRADDTNLSLGKPYTVEYESPIEHAYPAYTYKSETVLTDGKFTTNMSYSDSAFLELYRGTAVTVTIDLGELCAVSSVELRTLQSKAAGVYCARYVKVAVSENGTDFASVANLTDEKSVTDSSKKMITHKVELDKAYLARYVSVTFSCDVYTYVDEVTVYGSTDPSGAVSATPDAPAADLGYAKEIDGIGNIVLMYTVGNYTKDKLLPYFAYVDTAGEAKDTMFDSMLFLPSPASGYDFSKPDTWQKYIDSMFGASGKTNLTALNELVGEMRETLSLDNGYRYPVFLAIPYLEIGSNSFNGVRPNNLANRTKIVSAYIDQMIGLFADSGFDNLELKGFYWFHESIAYSASDYEEDFMINFNAYVHDKGLKSIWIPYYCAPGFERAVDLGFDAATLQSGYAFPRSGDSLNLLGAVMPESVDDSAMQARKYGLGMEFELDIGVTDAYERFYKYMHTGYSTGCMDGGMMMLYQAVDGILKCANSPGATDQRKLYDMLYLYNKQKFTSDAPVIEPDQVIVANLGSRTSGTLSITDNDSLKSKLNLVDIVASEGLTYVLEGDGFYILNTKESVAGMYSITFSVTDGYNVSEQATVKVFLTDFSAPSEVLTLDKEMVVYNRLNESSEPTAISVGASVNVYDMEDGWSYVTATVDGEDIEGFVKLDRSKQNDTSEPDTPSAPSSVIWIVLGAAVAVAAVVVILIIVKKQKNKG